MSWKPSPRRCSTCRRRPLAFVSPASNATCTPTTIPRRTRSCAAIRTPSTCGARARSRSRLVVRYEPETAPARGGRGNAARIRRMRAGRGQCHRRGVGHWPAGTELLRMGRRRHGWAPRAGELDGSRARSAGCRWRATLGRPTVQLDENRQLLAVSDAELACPLTLGEMRYPAGTQVKTAGYPLRQRRRSPVFSPVAPGQATRGSVAAGERWHGGGAGAGRRRAACCPTKSARFARIIVNETDPQEPPGAALMRGRRDVRARPTGT